MLEGTITHVMESWPLQLMVQCGAQSYVVELVPDAAVTRAGEPVDPGQLQPATAVRIRGQLHADCRTGMLAEEVEILE